MREEERRVKRSEKCGLAEGGWRESADGGLVDKARQAVVKCDRSEDLLRKYACIHSYLLVYDQKQLRKTLLNVFFSKFISK